jgi:hypothetical protein
MIKGMLDDGAHCGISIGALVKGCENRKINNKSVNVYTKLELVEASFVAIPSNRHGMAMALAKKFSEKVPMTEQKTYSEEEFLTVVAEKNSLISDLEKVKAEVELLKQEKVDAEKKLVEQTVEKDAHENLVKEIMAMKEAHKQTEEKLEKLQNRPVYKAVHTTPEAGDNAAVQKYTNTNGLPVIIRQ